MLINRESLDALFRSYLLAFQEGMTGVGAVAPDAVITNLATEFPSNTTGNFYAWLDALPGFREWVGDRVAANITAKKFEVLNRDFEATYQVKHNDLKDDNYGMLTAILRGIGANWPEKLRQLQIAVLTSNMLAFDGVALFGTHAYGSNTVTNLTSNALTRANYEAALLAASAWKFSNGQLIRPRFTHLVVGEKLRGTAYNIVKSENLVESNVLVSNPNKGRQELLVWPELAGDYDDYWFLLDMSGSIKPVALQLREKPAPKMDVDPLTVEKQGFALFFATGRAAAAPTYPHLGYAGIL